jgi:DNA ligase-1
MLLAEVVDTSAAVAATRSRNDKIAALAALLDGRPREVLRIVVPWLGGELRQGALEGVLSEAVARAARVPGAAVRRAAMLSGNLVGAALAALEGGEEALAAFRLELFRPIQPMLAQTADGVADALQLLGPARLEAKLDGARVQVHRKADRVELWTRQLLPVGPVVPEVVEAVLALPVDEIVLDGEVRSSTCSTWTDGRCSTSRCRCAPGCSTISSPRGTGSCRPSPTARSGRAPSSSRCSTPGTKGSWPSRPTRSTKPATAARPG